MELPKYYDFKEAEPRISKFWEDKRTYKFDPEDAEREIYSVDTPPPTVSGKMHIGHAFSYTQQDFIVRFQRMLGKNVFYPFGTDDNGLPTERLVEKMHNVKGTKMDRKEFTELCTKTVNELRPKYIQDWKNIGTSCDWSIFYSTIDKHSQRISQKSFLDLLKAGREYRKEAPVMWCTRCQTAIAQVECEDEDLSSYFNDIIFKSGDEELIISTTRPEFIPACVALFFHPDDKRYQHLKGKKAKVPLFDYEVPILTDDAADPEKGTGLMMVCTFGDKEDVEKWFKYGLELRSLLNKDGKLTEIAGKYADMTVTTARKMIIEDMKDARLLISQEPIKHSVKVHDKCGTEIEFIKTKQWFIKYLDLKDKMLKWGSEMEWYPKHMKTRYDHWVEGLQWDWLISRQRFFGVPFPVWYCTKCDEVITANEKDLPVDPTKDKPPVNKCPKCGSSEFVPERDVLDTWATSSLTPQLSVELMKGKPVYDKLYPMSLRPQAHDIITFWLFNTVVKSQLHNHVNPWKDVAISGHALDPHGKKMSKSKGNVVEPQEVIEKYGADALRFWAASSKLGEDLPYMEKDLVTGKKLVTKLWNASKFAIMHLEDFEPSDDVELRAIDRWVLSKLFKMIKASTDSFMKYEYARTKADVELFFWNTLCDNYLEIVKHRLYNPDSFGKDSRHAGQYSLYTLLLSCLKLLAPIMPFITEEIYQLYFSKKEGCKSIHNSPWPKYEESFIDDEAEEAGDIAVDIISAARKFKTTSNASLKTLIKKLSIACDEKLKSKIELVIDDIKETIFAEDIEYVKKADIKCDNCDVSLNIVLGEDDKEKKQG